MVTDAAHPPETLEGWYAVHQIYTCAKRPVHPSDTPSVDRVASDLAARIVQPKDGWSAVVRLIGSMADLMVIHFRPTLDDIAAAQDATAPLTEDASLDLVYSFLSVTEAGLYHLTARLAQETAARGGAPGDAEWTAELAKRVEAERSSDHVRRRLYPAIPTTMPYVCFYPMSKRRDAGQNWYGLTLDERSRLMHSHGLTGRKYAGRVQQIITGSIGFENWEWGVTLFAKDPLDVKKLVTEMRFDEASAKYAEFGDFFIGRIAG